MSLFQATFAMLDALEKAKVAYMLSGSLASMYYSFPRATTDADFVLELGSTRLSEIADLLGPGFRIDPQMMFESVTGTTKNDVEVIGTPFKIELFRLSSQPFDRERFSRRIKAKLLDRTVWLPTPEDVIIQKLLWNRPKDREDVIGVIAAQRTTLDIKYIHRWCDELGSRSTLEELWESSPELHPPNDREGSG